MENQKIFLIFPLCTANLQTINMLQGVFYRLIPQISSNIPSNNVVPSIQILQFNIYKFIYINIYHTPLWIRLLHIKPQLPYSHFVYQKTTKFGLPTLPRSMCRVRIATDLPNSPHGRIDTFAYGNLNWKSSRPTDRLYAQSMLT